MNNTAQNFQQDHHKPDNILAQCTVLNPLDVTYLEHPIIKRFGNSLQPIYVDQTPVDIAGIKYGNPLIMPIVNGELEIVQCAVLQDGQRVSVTPDGLAKGFTKYGNFDPAKPVIITYDLEAFFKIAQTGYAVALVILPTLCNIKQTALKPFNFEQIQFVIKQLSQAGFKQLYIPVRPKHIQLEDFQKLEQNTGVRLLNHYHDGYACDLTQYDAADEVQVSFDYAIKALPEKANPLPLESDADLLENDILRLANLNELQYEQTRTAEAKMLDIRASLLDKLVKVKRKEIAENKKQNDFFEHVEAWHAPVDGGELLNSIEKIIDNHIACEPQTRIATALWILFTWSIDASQIAPIACITAPEKRCGKTQLLTLIGDLCYKPLPTLSISSAATYRSIEEWKPTLLIDEADTFLKENEEMRGVINAGHSRKNAFVIRCEGDDNKPTRFGVYCAKAISGIGHLPETIKDRSIILELRRKLPSEHKQRLRHADESEWHMIKRQCLRWVNDNFEDIKLTRPQLPEQLHDRAQDNWEILFILAQLAGNEWLEKANKAALLIDGAGGESPSINEQLLGDIQKIFQQHDHKNMFSFGLVDALNADEENIWITWNRGKPITQNQLATRLKYFSIKSKDVRIGSSVKKGYELSQFSDAFNRYLPKKGI